MLFSNIAAFTPNGIVTGLYVGIEGDSISYISPDMPEKDFGRVYDGGHKLLMPGFVNTHCHVAMTLLRGLGEDLPLSKWLNEKILPMEAIMTQEDAYWGSLLGIAEMLRNGITSFTDMYVLCEGIAKAVLQTGIKCNLSYGLTAHGGAGIKQNGQLQKAEDLYHTFSGGNQGRLLLDIALHAEYTTNSAVVVQAVDFAALHQLRMHLHLSETRREQEECLQRNGVTPAAYFQERGVFDLPVTAAHCVAVSPEDIEILADKHVFVAHCPASNLKLGSGVAPVCTFVEKGIPVTIGTDGAASNNTLDILHDARLCALLQKGVSCDPTVMNTSTVLRFITAQGAQSQGRMDCGSIEIGKKADLCVINMKNAGLRQCEADLLYGTSSGDVCLTMVDGDILYENGVYTNIDMEFVLNRIYKIREKFL